MEERAKRFELLSDLYRFLTDAPQTGSQTEETFRWILQYARVGPEKLVLAVMNEWDGSFQPMADVGLSHGPLRQTFFRGGVMSHIEVVRQSQQAVLFRDAAQDGGADVRAFAQAESIQTFWVFPILARGTVIGTLGVGYPDQRELTSFEGEYWRRVTETLAIFIRLLHQQQEQTLEKQRFSATLDMTGAGVVGFWSDGRVAFHNQRFQEMFHLASEDIQGHYETLLSRIAAQLSDPEAVSQAVHALVRRARPDTRQIVAEIRGVIPRRIRMRTRPLMKGDVLQGWLAVFDDYTREYAAETQQTAFLSLVAHEFRTPIAVIAGVTEWLMGEPLEDPVIQDQIRVISRESTRLMRLIREVWLSVNLDDPVWLRERSPVCVAAVVREETALRQPRVFLYRGPEHISVEGSREIITTIVSVLLSNAVRFSPVDQAIDVALSPSDDGGVQLVVKDRGPGVEEALQQELFTRMPDPRERPSVGGIGLGLWLSRQLLDRLGGRIQYASRTGGGSVFTVWFPRRPQHLRSNAPDHATGPV